MKLKIPPPLVVVFFGLLMYGLARVLPIGHFEFFGRLYLVKGLLILAIAVIGIALVQFFKNKTTTNPIALENTSKLVTNGIYAFSRNPMYLGFLLVVLAWGLWLENAFNILIAAGYVSYMNKFQIIPEEKMLTKIFKKKYQHYCVQVRRWF